MRKLKILIEYEGTQYHGWQCQANGLAIQEVLQKTLKKITQEKKSVVASGRTDAGVHAEGQVAHFFTSSRMTPRELLKAFNSLLPPDIVVKKVEEVHSNFHAQKSATRKTYRYTILNRDFPSALGRRQAHYIASPLNVSAMRRAAKYLVGKHDFSAFQGAGGKVNSTVREINSLTIQKKNEWIYFNVVGNGFLKYMVRNIVGTLIQVGQEKITVKQTQVILQSRDRTQAGPTAPARGLCLVTVKYGVLKTPGTKS